MSKYERFIIYPLLFVALFYGLTGGQPFVTAAQIADEMIWDRIVAREIVVVNEEENEAIRLHSDQWGQGEVITYNDLGGRMTSMGYSILQFGTLGSTMISPVRMVMQNNDGEGIISIGLNELNGGHIQTSNKEGTITTRVTQQIGTGGGMINIYNAEGIATTNISQAIDTGGGAIATQNRYGDSLVLIAQTAQKHGGIWVYDKYGEASRGYGHR